MSIDMSHRIAILIWLLSIMLISDLYPAAHAELPEGMPQTELRKRVEEDNRNRQLIKQCSIGDLAAVQGLVEQGADVNSKSGTRVTPLHAAAEGGHIAVMKFLIAQGAEVNATRGWGRTVLVSAAQAPNAELAMQMLMDAGATPNATSLRLACWKNLRKIAELQVDRGADPSVALYVAVLRGDREFAEYLIRRGADINAYTTLDGKGTVLHQASVDGNIGAIQLAHELGVNVNVPSKSSQDTAVFRAKNAATLHALVEAGARLDVMNSGGFTPARIAAADGDLELYEMLVTVGGGTEPQGKFYDEPRKLKDVAAECVFTDLLSNRGILSSSARRELVARGDAIVPLAIEKLQSLAPGEPFSGICKLFIAMGPTADEAIPVLREFLNSQEHRLVVATTLLRMRPGGSLSHDEVVQKEIAEALFQAATVNDTTEDHEEAVLRQMICTAMLGRMGSQGRSFLEKLDARLETDRSR